jgi:hypothetical protein
MKTNFLIAFFSFALAAVAAPTGMSFVTSHSGPLLVGALLIE